jgi:DNA invertase Pin-like site-specific DNA recombinase
VGSCRRLSSPLGFRRGPFAKEIMVVIGYARVSRGDDQSKKAQIKVLTDAGRERVFEEEASGARWQRPQLHRMLDQLRKGDTIVGWKLDRLSRSLKDVPQLMERIEAADAGFRLLTEAIDTTTPAGRMLLQMIGSFSEFGRAMVRERTTAGPPKHARRAASAAAARGSMPRSVWKLPKACFPAVSPAPKWPGFMISASRPCHGSSQPNAR